jgi:hypothetical protein
MKEENTVLKPLNCSRCKGRLIKPGDYDEKIANWRLMQIAALKNIKSVKLYILLPFLSPDRFFYDLNTDAWHRNDLKKIFLKGSSDENFINYLNERGIVIIECCFCPLHRLFFHDITLSVMPEVITTCFKRHNLVFLKINKTAPVITLFDDNDTTIEDDFPGLKNRIIRNFDLNKLLNSNKRFLKLVDSIIGK